MTPRAPVRAEIQALRALAVAAVVLYHLWPTRLPGGYVGVDIFFVISGFLIIGHLLRDMDRTGGISLSQFWARRARRLLPASLLVLAVTGIATVALVPSVFWGQWFREIGASALYAQNWVLAADAVDYLGADNAASPVQHFWSLSAEEQFYIFWPLLIALIVVLCRRYSRLRPRFVIGVALVVLASASLVYSTVAVAIDPAPAYFVTPSRAWEFGIGGLLAYFAAHPLRGHERLKTLASWLGIAAVATTLAVYTPSTPFPGMAALLPVVGTLLVIWAGTPATRWSAAALFRLKPVQWLGDVSYSLYLWHWPLIVILPFVIGHDLGLRSRVGILVVALALAWLTKVLVEDPVRTASVLVSRPAWVSIASTLTASAVVVAACGFAYERNEANIEQAATKAAAASAVVTECFAEQTESAGGTCAKPFAVTALTNPSFAETDIGKGVQITDQCKQTLEDSAVMTCDVGDVTSPTKTLALIGDSHAGHFLETLDVYGQKHHVKFVTYIKTWCAGTSAEGVRSPDGASAEGIRSCTTWGKKVLDTVAADPRIDGAVFSNYIERYEDPSKSGLGRPVDEADFATAWSKLVHAGKSVVALRDIPNANGEDVPECIAQHLDEYDPCSVPRADAMLPDADDPMIAAAHAVRGVSLIDLSDNFCDSDTCHTIFGGQIVYFDGHHMSASFSRAIAPVVGDAIRAAVSTHG